MFTSVSVSFSVPEAMQEWPVFCAFLPHSGKRLIRIYSQMKLELWVKRLGSHVLETRCWGRGELEGGHCSFFS